MSHVSRYCHVSRVLVMPGGQVGWVGLQDFLNEGTFTWADGSSLGSYTNWANNQPDNNGQGQVRVWSRVTCDV